MNLQLDTAKRLLEIENTVREVHSRHKFSDDDELAGRIYDRVHCRLDDDGHDRNASNRVELAALLREVQSRLSQVQYDYEGFTTEVLDSVSVVLRSAEGVRVHVDREQVSHGREQTRTSSVLTATPIGLGPDSRWIHWAPPAIHPERPNARIYLNAVPEFATEVWCRTVSRLTARGVPFKAKMAGTQSMLERADALVIYLSRSDLVTAVDSMAGVAAHQLHPLAAGFSTPVSRGIGVSSAEPTRGSTAMLPSVGFEWALKLAEALRRGASVAAELKILGESWDATWDLLSPDGRRENH